MKIDKFLSFCVYSLYIWNRFLDTIIFDCDKKGDYLYEICVSSDVLKC